MCCCPRRRPGWAISEPRSWPSPSVATTTRWTACLSSSPGRRETRWLGIRGSTASGRRGCESLAAALPSLEPARRAPPLPRALATSPATRIEGEWASPSGTAGNLRHSLDSPATPSVHGSHQRPSSEGGRELVSRQSGSLRGARAGGDGDVRRPAPSGGLSNLHDPARSPTPALRRHRRKRAGGSRSLDLDALCQLTRGELVGRWQELYGSRPPAQISRELLLRAVAYRMQEEAYGGLAAKTRRQLARATRDLAAGRSLKAPAAKIKPGIRLLREWQGVVHEVIVLEDSVLYRGKDWPSLSVVAREITGARWSGPRFFGLNGKARGRR